MFGDVSKELIFARKVHKERKEYQYSSPTLRPLRATMTFFIHNSLDLSKKLKYKNE